MAFYTNDTIDEVERVARIYYLNKHQTKLWNDNKRGNELRLLTGWVWVSKANGQTRMGFKTRSVALRDAFYTLVKHKAAPGQSEVSKLRPTTSPTTTAKRTA